MAKALVYLVNGPLSPNVESTDTFASWINTTNQLVYDMGTVVLTATANAQPNGTTSAAGWTIGNSHLEGFLSANTLIAATALRGGTVSTTTDLLITSNTVFSQGSLVLVGANTNNFTVNANNTLFTSNVAISNTSKTFTISAANTTINDGAVYVKTSAWFTGSTTDILGTSAIVTSNTTFTSNTMYANVDLITLGANASDSLVVNSIADFNSNTNVDGILTVTANAAFTGTNTTFTAVEATGEIRLKGTSTRVLKTQSTNATIYDLQVVLANTSGSVTPLVVNSTSVSPGVTTTFDFGGTSSRWNKGWVKDLDVANTVNIQVDGQVGRDMIVYRNLYVYGNTTLSSNVSLSLSTSDITDLNVLSTISLVNNAGFDTNASPTANTTYSLGTTNLRWNQVFANNVTTNSVNTNTITTANVNSDLIPSANVTYSIGTTNLRWNQLFANNITVGTIGATTVTAALSGNATTATTLQTARTINGVSFNGSADISVTANTTATLTRGTYLTGSDFNGGTARTWSVDADPSATASKVVARDASSNFAANTITAALTGNATTATTLQNARTINGVSFNGSANITITANTNATHTRGTYLTGSNFDGSTAVTWSVDADTAATASKVVARDVSSNFAANTITAALVGNATTATTLQTARNINGVSFNGSGNITITASTTNALTRGLYLTGSNFDGSAAVTWAVDADSAATASKVVVRDASSNFAANTITATLFSGSGASLTSLNGSNISSGTVADARIASTLVRTSTTLTAGEGMYGGGDLSANRALGVDTTVVRTANTQSITGVTTMSNLRLSGAMLSSANNTVNLGAVGNVYLAAYATTFYGTATSAQYADLAEKYLADDVYDVGTVIAVGGTAEVTAANIDNASAVLGVVSDSPAYLMNSNLEGGTTIALKGRVPVKVVGEVKKGDRLAPSVTPGYAWVDNTRGAWSFAIALENGNNMVEAVIL